ncbi:MAG: BolA/IbaG family iron-sulfur metabolism protein [Planctomycetes bacterium]|nr:BolA/IbaG family iron-sulfur metabolism protein [Planctomycetota bacterium]
MSITPGEVESILKAGLPEAEVHVTGDGRHFEARIVSNEFEGLGLIARHRKVYAALGEKMGNEVHALSIIAKTQAELGG